MRISDWSSDVCASDLIQEPVRALEHAAREMRLSLNDLPVRGSGSRLREGGARDDAMQALAQALADLSAALAPLVSASPGFANLDERLAALRLRLQAWLMQPAPLTPDDDIEPDFDDPPPQPAARQSVLSGKRV